MCFAGLFYFFFTQVLKKLRNISAVMLVNCDLPDPKEIWDAFKDDLSENILNTA